MPLKARDREILVRVRVEFDQPIKLSHESVDRRPDHALRLGPNCWSRRPDMLSQRTTLTGPVSRLLETPVVVTEPAELGRE